MRRIKIFQLHFNEDFNNLLSNNKIYSLSKYGGHPKWGYPSFNQSGIGMYEVNTTNKSWFDVEEYPSDIILLKT